MAPGSGSGEFLYGFSVRTRTESQGGSQGQDLHLLKQRSSRGAPDGLRSEQNWQVHHALQPRECRSDYHAAANVRYPSRSPGTSRKRNKRHPHGVHETEEKRNSKNRAQHGAFVCLPPARLADLDKDQMTDSKIGHFARQKCENCICDFHGKLLSALHGRLLQILHSVSLADGLSHLVPAHFSTIPAAVLATSCWQTSAAVPFGGTKTARFNSVAYHMAIHFPPNWMNRPSTTTMSRSKSPRQSSAPFSRSRPLLRYTSIESTSSWPSLPRATST